MNETTQAEAEAAGEATMRSNAERNSAPRRSDQTNVAGDVAERAAEHGPAVDSRDSDGRCAGDQRLIETVICHPAGNMPADFPEGLDIDRVRLRTWPPSPETGDPLDLTLGSCESPSSPAPGAVQVSIFRYEQVLRVYGDDGCACCPMIVLAWRPFLGRGVIPTTNGSIEFEVAEGA